MFKFLKGKPSNTKNTDLNNNNTQPETKGFFSKLKNKLIKTRVHFTTKLTNLLLGKKNIDTELLDELEHLLISADIGVDTAESIIHDITQQVKRKDLQDPQALTHVLYHVLLNRLTHVEKPLITIAEHQPFVLLMVGINGAGKTTTIGKLAKHFQTEGKKVMLAAGDTFRAAAIEQLCIWGERNQIPVIKQQSGADSASVIYDAYQAAKARGIDILIADTAGRLHTQANLMEELKKVVRVIKKINEHAPHEIMLVLDAGTGQNACLQAQQFHAALNLSGLTITKLDGTAKGGVIFAIASKLQIPIRYIGIGEGIDDLKPFEAKPFVDALFATDTTTETDVEDART